MEDDERMVRGRPLWPWILGMAVLTAVAVLAYVLWPRDPSPARVLVAVHGCAASCESALAGALRAQLSGTFDVVVADASDPEGARTLAAENAAEHALFALVEPHERREASAAERAYT